MAIACRLRNIPLIYDILDNYELRYRWPRPIYALIQGADRMIARWAKVIIVPDENRIIGGIANERDKITVVYICAPDYGTPRYPDFAQPFVVYAMGFLGKRRGIGLLLEAARALPDIQFILAGNFLEHDIKETALGIRNVRYAGYVPWEAATELAWQSDVVFAVFRSDL